MKNFLFVILGLFLIVLGYFGYRVTLVEKKVSSLEKSLNVLMTQRDQTTVESKKGDLSENPPERYIGSVLQIGGEGSKFIQKTMYNPEDDSYLFDEDLLRVSYNRPVDLITAECKDDYEVVSCSSNSNNKVEKMGSTGCRMLLEDKLQNRVQIECQKVKNLNISERVNIVNFAFRCFKPQNFVI